jgi:hypothetical protein
MRLEDSHLRERVSRSAVVVIALVLAAPTVALLRHHRKRVRVPSGVALSTHDISPVRKSKLIVGASWTSGRYAPPRNQEGDILPTIWADDGHQYTIMDDGGTDVPKAGALWRQSMARITGSPPRIRFSHIGDPSAPPPRTWSDIDSNPALHEGPLGAYYSSGLVEVNRIFYATQEKDWNWNANGPFAGLAGIAYSTDHGGDWQFVYKPFPAPLGNLNWVIQGRGGVYPDRWVYAIATEREFNASRLIIGRSRPDAADITDPSRWQWLTGWRERDGQRRPVFSGSFADAAPILDWSTHITYPQMVYDAPLHRYLLTLTYSYASVTPAVWKDGAELVILEAPHPWGPFSFVARDSEFGPSNGYGASFPIKWISTDGRDVWLKWAANFAGCAANLDCTGGYGFNYRRIHLVLDGDE